MRYCFTIYSDSRLELFSYDDDDHDKFIPTSLNSVVVEGLKSVLWSSQGLSLICQRTTLTQSLIKEDKNGLLSKVDVSVHNHDFDTIADTMLFPGVGSDVDASCSPGKKYLVLVSKTKEDLYRNSRHQREITEIKIIDMKSGLVKVCFSIPGRDVIIRWEESSNDQYFTLPRSGTLSLYGTNNFEQIGAPLQCNGCAWSPTGSKLIIISPYFGLNNHASRSVKVLEIPSRNIVFEKPLLSGVNLFYWQSKEEHVAILHTGLHCSSFSKLYWIVYSLKTNTTSCGSFEENRFFFDFKWEPNGSRFAYSYMTRDMSCAIVEFYRMELVEGNIPRWSKFTSLNSSSSFTSEINLCYSKNYSYENTLSWSPAGRYIVVKYNKELGFVDVDTLEILAIVKFTSSFVAWDWDPSGRFVQTLCNCGGELKNIIWSFRGEKLYEFSAGKTMNWGGRFPVADRNEYKVAKHMEDDTDFAYICAIGK